MSFYGDPYGFGGGYGPPSYYPAYPAQYYSSGNTVYHHRRKPPKEKDNAQVWCDVCDVGCIGQQSYIEHCGGRKHQLLERKKAQQLANLSSASPQEGQRPIETDQLATATATTTTTGSSTVRFNPYESSATQGTKGSQGKFYCELCKIYSNDHSTFQLHLAGKKHKISTQRQQSAADPYGPNVNPISPMSVIHPPRYHIPSSPRTHFTPTLTNTPTNVEDDLLLNSKLESLTPSTSDTLSLRHLVETVTAKLEDFSDKNPSSQQAQAPTPVVMETKLVGPYAWGTLLKVNLVADIAVITKEHPTFGTLRYMQQALSSAIPEAQIEIGKDTMDMHIRMPQGTSVHLLFTWVGAWESGERPEDPYMYSKPPEYPASPSSSPSPSSPSDSPFPPLTYTNHPTSEPSAKTPAGGPWVMKPWTTTSAPWIPSSAPPLSPHTPTPTPTPTTTATTTTTTISTRSPSHTPTPHEDGTSHPPSSYVTQGLTSPTNPVSSSPPSQTPSTPPESSQAKGPDPSTPSTETQDINMLASQRALLMIRQAMWFSHNSLSPNVRQCIKIMKDLSHRHTAFAAVNNWALEVMVVNALRTLPLSASISQSLRAIFAFVASGTLLPGVDLLDPCVQNDQHEERRSRFDYGSVLQDLTQEDRLAITKAAQKILNDIAFGRWEVIVG